MPAASRHTRCMRSLPARDWEPLATPTRQWWRDPAWGSLTWHRDPRARCDACPVNTRRHKVQHDNMAACGTVPGSAAVGSHGRHGSNMLYAITAVWHVCDGVQQGRIAQREAQCSDAVAAHGACAPAWLGSVGLRC
jgi:hypothetical protein